jgi:hypothetical protein
MSKFLNTARTVRVPTAENVVRNGLKASETGLVAFDVLPYFVVGVAVQFAFREQTFLQGRQSIGTSFCDEDLFKRFGEPFPQAIDPNNFVAQPPLPFMLEWAWQVLTLGSTMLLMNFPWTRYASLTIRKSKRTFFVFFQINLNRGVAYLIQITVEDLGGIWGFNAVSTLFHRW